VLSLGRHPRDRCGVAALAHADSPAGAAIAVYKPCPVYVRKVWRRRWANVRCTRSISKKPCKSLADSDASEHDCKCWCPRFESGSRHPRKACKRRVLARRIVGRRISPDARTGPFRAFSAPSDRQMRVPRRTSDPACVSGGPSWAPFGAWARPGGGPIPRHQHAGQGVPPSGGESAHQRAALELRGAVEVPRQARRRCPPSVSGSGWRPARCCSRTWPRPRRARGVPRRRGQETLPHPPGR
jgi:hypothetical protein